MWYIIPDSPGFTAADRQAEPAEPSTIDPAVLDALMAGAQGEGPPLGIVNGRMDVSNPAAADYGWTEHGNVDISLSRARLDEDDVVFSGLEETFLIPAGTTALRFSILDLDLNHAGPPVPVPPDAFEAAILNAATMESLVPTIGGGGDAFLNIQANGTVTFGNQTQVSGVATSGQVVSPFTFPTVVTVNLPVVAQDTAVTLYFDLLGFGAVDSHVVIDTVTLIGYDAPPLTVRLANGFDSGITTDNITNISPVTLEGTTDPLAIVALDRDGDGFDDGTTTASITGQYSLAGVTLAAGINPLRVSAGVAPGNTIAPLNVTFDNAGPVATLRVPAVGAQQVGDNGFVEIVWQDTLGGVDPASFGIDDVVITGVTVESFFHFGGGRVQYYYSGGNEMLPAGAITVQLPAGRVRDLAGNTNALQTQGFTQLLSLDAGRNIANPVSSPSVLNGARFRYNGNHADLTLTIDWGDGQVETVPLPAGSGGANINAQHNYATLGFYEVDLRLRDNASHEITKTISVAVFAASCPWQNPVRDKDVNGDTQITALDAVLIINELNARGPRALPNPPLPGDVPPPYTDVSCDNTIAPFDAVLVINHLNAGGGGEFVAPIVLTAPPQAQSLVPSAAPAAAEPTAAIAAAPLASSATAAVESTAPVQETAPLFPSVSVVYAARYFQLDAEEDPLLARRNRHRGSTMDVKPAEGLRFDPHDPTADL